MSLNNECLGSVSNNQNTSNLLQINKVYNMDCLAGMKNIQKNSVDMVLCDLPYGITRNKWDNTIPLEDYIAIKDKEKFVFFNKHEYLLHCYHRGQSIKQAIAFWNNNYTEGLWTHYMHVLKDTGIIVLTANQPFTAEIVASNPKMFKYSWCWKKSLKTNFLNAKKQPLRNHEDILIFYNKFNTYNPQGLIDGSISGGNKATTSYNQWVKKESNQHKTGYPFSVLNIANPNNGNIHPTQKPIELGRYLIRTYTKENDVVLDNACGSGSFLIAAYLENRNFIGFESNAEYYTKMVTRMKQYDIQ